MTGADFVTPVGCCFFWVGQKRIAVQLSEKQNVHILQTSNTLIT